MGRLRSEAEWEEIRRRRRRMYDTFILSGGSGGGIDRSALTPRDPLLALYIELEDASGHLLMETSDELLLES